MSDDKESSERAKELLVYGPIGFAMFVRDSAPQFLRMFVARGRTEFEQRRRAVGEQLDQVRGLGESTAADGGPEMLRVISNGLHALRERAEEALDALGVAAGEPPSAAAPTREPGSGAAPGSPQPFPVPADADAPDLAIRGYQDLSASQIVDLLEGLRREELEAIRDYESTHRARSTILGKIEQLTRR